MKVYVTSPKSPFQPHSVSKTSQGKAWKSERAYGFITENWQQGLWQQSDLGTEVSAVWQQSDLGTEVSSQCHPLES